MTQNIQNRRSRAGRMKNFFAANNAEILPYADIVAEIIGFDTVLLQFDEFAVRQQQSLKGFTEEKHEALNEAAEIVTQWGIRCHVKAKNDGLINLANLLNHSEAEIVHLEDTDGLNLLKDIRDGLSDNMALFVGQGLTIDVINSINSKITAYEALINKPKEAISGRKMETEALSTLMKNIDERLENVVSLLASVWKNAHPDLVVEMYNLFQIDDLGHRFSGIQGSVANSVPELTNVADYKVILEKELKPEQEPYIKVAVSDLVGEYKIQTLKPGRYTAKLVSPQGSVLKTTIIQIERGKTLDYNWTV